MPKGIKNQAPVINEVKDAPKPLDLGEDNVARVSISKLSSSRDDRDTENRVARPVNRDVEEVVLPDGKKFIRVARTSVRNDNPSLTAPKKAGFYRRWFSEAKPGRLQEAVDLGFVPATDENGNKIQPRKGGHKDGQVYKMFLMEISEEMHAQLERDNEEKVSNQNKKVVEEHAGQDLGNNSLTYVAQDDVKFVTKQN